MKKMALHWKIIIGLILGIVWAIFSSYMGWNEFTRDWIDPFGTIFIRLLKFIAVPLVLFSIISGVSGLSDISSLGRMGAKTLVIYLVTTMTAVGLGLVLVNVVAPGTFLSEDQRKTNRLAYEEWVFNTDGVELMDDMNLTAEMGAAATGEYSGAEIMESNAGKIESKIAAARATKDQGPLQFVVDMVPENIMLSISNNKLMLQVIFFAIFFGITLVMIPGTSSAPVITFINGINDAFLKMVDIVMKAAPFFVFALMAGIMSKMADTPAEVLEIFQSLGWYALTVFLGLAFMVFVFYPLIMITAVKKMGYIKFFKSIGAAQLLAFSSSSSAATLPVTLECVTDNLKVNKKVSSFVLPIGATVNMDGTSLYQAVAVIFLAQMHYVDLSIGQQLIIILTATLASIGSAAVPSAGLIMLIIVLESVGLNPAWIAIIFPVDRILDMCRTVVNVTGDATVATIVAATEGELNNAA